MLKNIKSYPHFFLKVIPTFKAFCDRLGNNSPMGLSFGVISLCHLIFLLFSGVLIIEQVPASLLNTPCRRSANMDYQLPLPNVSAYWDLLDSNNQLVNYFRQIDLDNIYPIIQESYSCHGPHGYGLKLFLSRMLKVKQTFVSDRVLAKRLSENSTYRHLCLFDSGATPAHNTYYTLRKNLGVDGYTKIHMNFVEEAHKLGLLNPDIKALPKNRRKGLILIADSTSLKSYCSTKGEQQEDGRWVFTDPSVTFGRPHHKHKYPVGHKAHSLISIVGIPMVSVLSARNDPDPMYIFPLLDECQRRFPSLPIAYIILDAGYDDEYLHKTIYEDYDIIPIIVRKKMVYPKGFSKNGAPLCEFGIPMSKSVVDYRRGRTKYICKRACKKEKQKLLFECPHLISSSNSGYTRYIYFKDGYRKHGPATPNSVIYKKLKPFRTAIERGYGLLKENRYHMENTNTYMGFANVTMHVIEHDIVLTHDIIVEYKSTGKVSPVIKV